MADFLDAIGLFGGLFLLIVAGALLILFGEWAVNSVRLRIRNERNRKARTEGVAHFVEHPR